MGFLKRSASALGHVDKRLLKTGLPGRGRVIECTPTAMSVGAEGRGYGEERVCDVTVEVSGIDGRGPYCASCKHPIPLIYLPQMKAEGAVVAVRVDPADPQHIALDLASDPPPATDPPPTVDPDAGSVTIATPTGSVDVPTHASPLKAGDILARGTPCRAELLMSTPLGQKNEHGLEVMGLVFTVTVDSGESYQAQIGVGVPDEAMPLLVPKADLPARALASWTRDPAPPDLVTIDWDTAIAEHQAQQSR
jgi:hypothetical protein